MYTEVIVIMYSTSIQLNNKKKLLFLSTVEEIIAISHSYKVKLFMIPEVYI